MCSRCVSEVGARLSNGAPTATAPGGIFSAIRCATPHILLPNMSSRANKIRVDVETAYVDEQSDPNEHRFVFSYSITIRNEGAVPARLLTRHWIITDANGKVQEARGDGVVGEQPHLKPGQGFRYTSGAVIETPGGAMQGTYEMIDDEGQRFDAPIQPFQHTMPGIVQ